MGEENKIEEEFEYNHYLLQQMSSNFDLYDIPPKIIEKYNQECKLREEFENNHYLLQEMSIDFEVPPEVKELYYQEYVKADINSNENIERCSSCGIVDSRIHSGNDFAIYTYNYHNDLSDILRYKYHNYYTHPCESCGKLLLNSNLVYIDIDKKIVITQNISNLEVLKDAGYQFYEVKEKCNGLEGYIKIIEDLDNYYLDELLMNRAINRTKKPNLNIKLGIDSEGNYFSYDIGRIGHILIGGTFGTGKTQFLYNTIKQLIENNTHEEIKFIFSDCHKLDLINYSDIPYMLAPVITEPQGVVGMFRWLDAEQERRMELFLKDSLRNIDEYNEKYQSKVLPRIVIVINELVDISHEYSKVEKIIVKILQYSKYSGIHLILATQVSGREVLTATIKANTYSRIAFKTEDSISSFQLLDQKGAEELNGKGEFLFLLPESTRPIKLQNDYISKNDLTEFIKTVSFEAPKYNEELVDAINKDYLEITESQIKEAIIILKNADRISPTKIMVGLDVNHAKAVKIMEILEEKEIVSKVDPISKRRKFLGHTY